MTRSIDTTLLNIFAISVIAAFLCGCGSAYHLRRAAHHIEKAKQKGALIDTDTIYVHDTTYVAKFTADTVFQQVNFTDTLVHETTRTITKVKVDYVDRKVYVQTTVKPDTIVKVIDVPCEQIQPNRPEWLKWLLWVVVTCILVVLALVYKRKA